MGLKELLSSILELPTPKGHHSKESPRLIPLVHRTSLNPHRETCTPAELEAMGYRLDGENYIHYSGNQVVGIFVKDSFGKYRRG